MMANIKRPPSSFWQNIFEWIETLVSVVLMGIATLFFILINGMQFAYQWLTGYKDEAKPCEPDSDKPE